MGNCATAHRSADGTQTTRRHDVTQQTTTTPNHTQQQQSQPATQQQTPHQQPTAIAQRTQQTLATPSKSVDIPSSHLQLAALAAITPKDNKIGWEEKDRQSGVLNYDILPALRLSSHTTPCTSTLFVLPEKLRSLNFQVFLEVCYQLLSNRGLETGGTIVKHSTDLWVDPKVRVKDLKEVIVKAMQGEGDCGVCFRGKKIKDENLSLSDCKIPSKSTIQIHVDWGTTGMQIFAKTFAHDYMSAE